MDARSYAFRVGEIACAVLLDGASLLGRAGILKRFHDATEADYERTYADLGLSLDEADTSFNTLVAEVGGEVLLVDAGEGGRPKGGLLPESLRLAGIEREAVTRVVITHADGDHVQGLLTVDERPTFPNATYMISSNELAYWQGRIDAGIVNHRPYLDLMRGKGLRLIEGDAEILPGVRAVSVAGHTPGHTAVLIESRGERVIHMADLLHSPMQFAHPDWSASFDVDTSVSVPARRAALGRAADEDMLAVFYHLTFPGLGRVRRAGNGFRWEPVKTE
jgi:glyoxylase-like metal-dependent hydrolase (beta-lactamase superfamily II)